MIRQQDVKTFEDIFTESWREIDQILRDRLAKAGIREGAVVRYNGPHGRQALYRITHMITNAGHDPRRYPHIKSVPQGHAGICLYGHQYRKDGSFGTAIHTIGKPHDVEVVK